jgi:hypothetical protein
VDKEIEKIIKKRKDVAHDEELGNNYYPSGWKPNATWVNADNKGEVTAISKEENPKFNYLLSDNGFDPKVFEIIEDTIRFSTWQTQKKGGEIVDLYAFKFQIRKKNPHHDKYYDELLKEIKKKTPIKKQRKVKADTSWVFCMSDFQLGKKDYKYKGKKGSVATVTRINEALEKGVQQLENFKKIGKKIDTIYLISLGDLVEGTCHFYPNQAYVIDLDRSQQEHLMRKMIIKIIDTFLPYGNEIVLSGVVSNHSENRSAKASVATTRLDDSGQAQLQVIGEILEQNKMYDKVKVLVPDGYHLTLKISNRLVGFTHGHLAGFGGGDSWKKMETFWKGQMYGKSPLADCSILISGHYHHFRAVEQGAGKDDMRLWLQCPSVDDSEELYARTGLKTKQGVLTLTVNEQGWDDLKIL